MSDLEPSTFLPQEFLDQTLNREQTPPILMLMLAPIRCRCWIEWRHQQWIGWKPNSNFEKLLDSRHGQEEAL